MTKKITSIILSVLMLASMLSVLSNVSTVRVNAATTSQQHMADRANYMYESTWVCQKTVSGWRENYTFSKGTTYRVPYGQPATAGVYIGFDCFGASEETYKSVTANASSKFYTSKSHYNYKYSTYYANDCSAFVSYCWGHSRCTTTTIPNISTKIGAVTTSNVKNKLQLGDALNLAGSHVVIVSDITYDSSGQTSSIVITEQTPPQLKRTTHTVANLVDKYSSYTIYRYTGTVSAAPGEVSSSTTTSSLPLKYSQYYPVPSSTSTLNEALTSIGVDNSKEYRAKIAAANGMTDYSYTAAQNTQLLNLLVSGKMINPDYVKPVYFPAASTAKTTLIEALASVGCADTSKEYRTTIATDNGIANYTGTAEQNTYMLELLYAGTLINPDGEATTEDNTNSTTETEPKASVDYSEEVIVEEAMSTVSGVNLGDKFNAFVYNITSWKLITSGTNGNAVINQKKGDGSQLLTFKRRENGTYNIYTEDGYVLTAENNGSSSGTNVSFSAFKGKKGQRWVIEGSDGAYKLRPECSSSCYLEVLSNGTSNGTNLQLGSSSTGDKQKFQILQYDGKYTRTGYENGYVASGDAGLKGSGKVYCKGADLSKHNEKDWDYSSAEFNFKGLKAGGYDYVILRAGSTNLGKDPSFEIYYAAAKAAGLDVGAYFYTYATTTAAARADAKKFLSYIEGKKFEYPIYVDYEDPTQTSLSQAVSKSINLTMMTMIANEGYLTGIYTGYSMSQDLLMDDMCEIYESWIARYYDSTGATFKSQYSKAYGMYQYTSEASVPSSTWSGAVMDANFANKDYPSIVKKYGFNGYSQGEWSEDKYTYADGTTATGWLNADDKDYFMDSAGNLVNGWVEYFDTWYYFDTDGVLSSTLSYVLGDVNSDDKLNINDISYIQKVLSRHIDTSDELIELADVNGNGRLDILDVTYIQKYLCKYIDYFETAVY